MLEPVDYSVQNLDFAEEDMEDGAALERGKHTGQLHLPNRLLLSYLLLQAHHLSEIRPAVLLVEAHEGVLSR